MNFNLQIHYADGTVKDVVGIAADIVAFETRFDLSMANFTKEIKLTHLFFLAWHVEKRTGATALEFEPWLETIDIVQAGEAKK